MYKVLNNRLIIILVIVSTVKSTLFATVYYCSSVNEIINAMNKVLPGDEIVIAPGIYENESTNIISGSAAYFYSNIDGNTENPITIRSQNKLNRAVLKGDNINSLSVLRIEGDYWIVKDLQITSGQKGLVFDNSHYSKAINCEIWNTGNEAVHVRDGSDNVILDSLYIHNTGNLNPGYGEGIYIGTDKGSWSKYDPYCWNTTVRNCTIGPNVRAEAIDIKEGTKETIIEYCNFDATGISKEHYADSFIDLKGVRTYVRHNTFNRNNEANLTKGIAIIDRNVELSSYEHVIHDNIFNMDNANENIVEIYNDSIKIYAWSNARNPAGNMYNRKSIFNYCPNWYTWQGLIYYTLLTKVENGFVNPSDGQYAANSIIELEAIPNNGFEFSVWTGDLSGVINPTKVLMDTDKNISASFDVSTNLHNNKTNRYKLFNNPNPFKYFTTISYSISKQERVRLTVFNLSGEKIKVIVDTVQQAGTYNIKLNAVEYSIGIYIYQLQAGGYSISKRLLLID